MHRGINYVGDRWRKCFGNLRKVVSKWFCYKVLKRLFTIERTLFFLNIDWNLVDSPVGLYLNGWCYIIRFQGEAVIMRIAN